jgi:hypothetical protein
MFFKPMNISFIAASPFGNDWRCFMIFCIVQLTGSIASAVYTAFLIFGENLKKGIISFQRFRQDLEITGYFAIPIFLPPRNRPGYSPAERQETVPDTTAQEDGPAIRRSALFPRPLPG